MPQGAHRKHKTAYLLELCGLGVGFDFEIRPYGPFSEELELAARRARALGLIEEEERKTSRGSFYSIFRSSTQPLPTDSTTPLRSEFIRIAAKPNAAELALAATAAFLSSMGKVGPEETARRSEKVADIIRDAGGEFTGWVRRDPVTARDGRLQNAKVLYGRLMQVRTPKALPQIA